LLAIKRSEGGKDLEFGGGRGGNALLLSVREKERKGGTNNQKGFQKKKKRREEGGITLFLGNWKGRPLLFSTDHEKGGGGKGGG